MAFKGKYIVACIDGTGSHEWRNTDGSNSHVYRFYNTINADRAYWNGPGELSGGEVFGRGSGATVTGVSSWINKKIISLVKDPKITKKIGGFSSAEAYKFRKKFLSLNSEEKKAKRAQFQDAIRVVLVGHSRGGLIAICAAKEIILPIYWMGLYDAVDMHPTLEANVIHNVDHTAHALRSPSLGSRKSWGNCGRRSSGNYIEKIFHTSHGGVGGDPVLDPEGFTSDYTCKEGSLRDNISSYSDSVPRISKNCVIEASQAHLWMLSHARSKGLPI